jgi:hypothetical protein
LTAVFTQEESRQIQALVDEALSDLIEKRRKARPRLKPAMKNSAA